MGATLELNEFPRKPHPHVVATRGDDRVTGQLRPVPASMPGADGFKLRMVLPTARQGAGGVWTQGPEADASGRGTPLPPEKVSFAEPPNDRGGLPLWIPAVGIALAGAGVWSLRSGVGRRG